MTEGPIGAANMIIGVLTILVIGAIFLTPLPHAATAPSRAEAASDCGQYYSKAIKSAEEAEKRYYDGKKSLATESFAWSAIYRNCKKYGGN